MSNHHQQIGEEMLTRVMQYCDGVLDAQESALVAQEIAADPALQALADDLRLGATAAREVMAGVINHPVPIALAQTIVTAPEKVPVAGHFRKFIHGQVAAALIGLSIGAAAIGFWSSPDQPDSLRLAGSDVQGDNAISSSEFRAALFSALGARPALVKLPFSLSNQNGAQGTVSVVRWFDLSTGTPCAEFLQQQPAEIVATGLACRREDGGWEIMTLSPHWE